MLVRVFILLRGGVWNFGRFLKSRDGPLFRVCQFFTRRFYRDTLIKISMMRERNSLTDLLLACENWETKAMSHNQCRSFRDEHSNL